MENKLVRLLALNSEGELSVVHATLYTGAQDEDDEDLVRESMDDYSYEDDALPVVGHLVVTFGESDSDVGESLD